MNEATTTLTRAAILSTDTKEAAGSVAFLMSLLSFPSGIIAGEILNSNNSILSSINSPSNYITIVWLPFFLVGALQWLTIHFSIKVFRRHSLNLL
jgi:hypothetical protein